MNFGNYQQYFDHQDEHCTPHHTVDIETYIFEVWINSCGRIVMSINDTIYELFDDEGQRTVMSGIDLSMITALNIRFVPSSSGTLIEVRWNVPHLTPTLMYEVATLTNMVPLYNKKEDVALSLGSYFGVSHFFRGIIAYFNIDDASDSDDKYADISDTETDLIFDQQCPLGQYYNSGECTACHSTCTYCTDGSACDFCHSTCKACNDTKGPGSIDECTECYCGAELVDGRCVALENWYGPADNLKLKCQEGCDECLGTGEHECVMCSENYEMVEGCPGTCQWCDPDACDENGMPLCGNRGGPFTYQSSCDCGPGQYFDGMYCRNCTPGCEFCSVDVDGFICNHCEDGLVLWGIQTMCNDFIPFHYTGSNGYYYPKFEDYDEPSGYGYLFDIEFNVPEDDCQIYEWVGLDYIIRLHGGTLEGKGEIEEPLIFNDRGAWFDGKYDLMTFKLLKLGSDRFFQGWYKPHGNGALFSSNMNNEKNSKLYHSNETAEDKHNNIDYDQLLPGVDYTHDSRSRDHTRKDNGNYQVSYQFGINEGTLEYQTSTGFVFQSEQAIDYYMWAYLTFSLDYASKEYFSNELKLIFEQNGSRISEVFVPTTYDHPEPKSSHLIGASELHGNYVHHYRGFIKRIAMTVVEQDSSLLWHPIGGDTFCDSCDTCPEDGSCYGTCNWNHWHDDVHNRCQRCPLWCKKGCSEDGTC